MAANKDSVKVAVRVRPFNKREKDASSRCIISMNSNTTTIYDPRNPQNRKTFTFDYAYWSHSDFIKSKDGMLVPGEPNSRYADQRKVYQDLGQGILENSWQGYNATLLAYGQTGSGKSYSMIGNTVNQGIIPAICEELFKEIRENRDSNRQHQVSFSMLEIYNEQVVDLLSKSKAPGGLKVREDQQRGFYVEGLKSVPCESYGQIERLMEQGTRARTTASTNMNACSSRSHMVITIQLKQICTKENLTKQSNINLVDLAGSERQRSSGSEGDRLKEGTAVNLSLTTLGNVISSLAEVAVGKKSVHIPYRDSVLTKLLQSALGGNSRTVMIATLSPADICYEETLSTLRYAERTKKIQNQAVINESPSERLVKELKAENSKLLLKLSRLGQDGRRAEDETQGLRQLLSQNELQIQAIQALWQQHLEEARRDWEQQYADVTQERRMMQSFPYILNINEDPQLSGVVKHFIQEGEWELGLSDRASNVITVKGLGILDRHATFTNMNGKVAINPCGEAKVIVNGAPLLKGTELQHLDRIILGSNSTYLYIGFPSERRDEDWGRLDYDFFQSELAVAEGFDMDKLGDTSSKNGKANPSVLAVFHDYIKVMPMVTEANQMSQELNKGMEFKLEVKNLAMCDSKGHDLEKEITVKVTHKETKQVWVWSKAKFINRKFLMEELYQRHMEEDTMCVDREKDPFWDPVDCVHLGSAHVWLQSLAFCIKLEEQVEFLNSEGSEEAILQIHLVPCTATGEVLGEDDILIDPTELLGRRFDFQIHIIQGFGVKWLKEITDRGVQIGYSVYNHSHIFYTKCVWNHMNPTLEHKTQFAILSVSQDFLNYLQTNALVIDLWGLQAGCIEMASSMEDVTVTEEGSVIIDDLRTSVFCSTMETNGNHLPELYTQLTKLEQETELLRAINESLRKENACLKKQLKNTSTKENSESESKGGNHHRISSSASQPSLLPKRTDSRGSFRRGCDAEFAKALKVFYQSMSSVRRQLQLLRCHRPSEEDDLHGLQLFTEEQTKMLKGFGEQLELCISTLKQDVAAIVKRKRERSGIW
ncbi:kinesin-like protein KIF28P [Huso huso]|uniref:Kinesin-like protein KIF28P n=1 Tax=Huso huso TaxID=61971 RepID=A0ABR1A0H1_HUSHU